MSDNQKNLASATNLDAANVDYSVSPAAHAQINENLYSTEDIDSTIKKLENQRKELEEKELKAHHLPDPFEIIAAASKNALEEQVLWVLLFSPFIIVLDILDMTICNIFRLATRRKRIEKLKAKIAKIDEEISDCNAARQKILDNRDMADFTYKAAFEHEAKKLSEKYKGAELVKEVVTDECEYLASKIVEADYGTNVETIKIAAYIVTNFEEVRGSGSLYEYSYKFDEYRYANLTTLMERAAMTTAISELIIDNFKKHYVELIKKKIEKAARYRRNVPEVNSEYNLTVTYNGAEAKITYTAKNKAFKDIQSW